MPRSLDDVFPMDAASANLTVSVTSNRVALPGGPQPSIRIVNLGAIPVFMNIGDASVLASVGNRAIAANGWHLFKRDNPTTQTHVAGISSSSIVTLNIAVGEGKFH